MAGFLPKSLPLRLVQFSASRPRRVLAAYFLLIVIAALFANRIRIDSDFLALVPDNNEVVREFKTTVTRFGSIDMLLIALEIDPEKDPEEAIVYADIFAEELRLSENITWVEYRLQDFTAAAETLLDRVTLFMGPEELEDFLKRFEDEGMNQAVNTLADKVRNPLDVAFRDLLVRDPLGVAPLLTRKLDLEGMGAQFNSDSGYLISPNGDLLLMLVKPEKPAANLPFSRALLAELDVIRDTTTQLWHEEDFEGTPPNVLYGGGYAITVAEAGLIIQDMVYGVVGAMIAVVLLFAFAFGRLTAFAISALPLICGLIITFAFVVFAIGRLNSATSAFAALLIGLGVDFIIVLYGRYLEERGRGASHEEALHIFGKHTAVGVLLGAVTTSATFFAFMISGFKGLSELGLLTGAGVLLLVITVFLMLPALITLLEKVRPNKKFSLRAFGLQRLTDLSLAYPKTVIAICLVITVIFGIRVTGVRYDNDISNMRSPNNPGMQTQMKAMEAFGIRFTPMMVRVDGETEADVIAKTRAVLADLHQLTDGETLARIDSLLSFFPDLEDQQAVIARLDQFQLDGETYKTKFSEALRAEGLNPNPFMPSLEPMVAALNVKEPLSFASMKGTALEHLAERYLVAEDGVYSSIIYCYAPAGKWRGQMPPKLVEVIEAHPASILTGPVRISIELKKIVLKDAMIAMILGSIVVLLFLAWDLGGAKAGLFALIPLAVGMTWMIGAMTWFDFPVNFMNIFVFTMIIGIGVDYGIHLIHRWQETGANGIQGTSKTIMIAALTTVLGFGSLVLSHYPGLRSLGGVAILGAIFTAITSITLLPALLTLTHKFEEELAEEE